MHGTDAKQDLPSYATVAREVPRTRRHRVSRGLRIVLGAVLSIAALQYIGFSVSLWNAGDQVAIPLHAAEWLEKCQMLDVPPGPPPDFHSRTLSDRFVHGTIPTLITVCRQSQLNRMQHMLTVMTERDNLDWRCEWN